jgi:type IV pilus assembly protein PilB
MPFTESIKRMVVSGKPIQEIKKQAIVEGMITLRNCALLNAMRGKTSLEEVARVTLAD